MRESMIDQHNTSITGINPYRKVDKYQLGDQEDESDMSPK